MQFHEDHKNIRKTTENYIFPEDEGCQNGRQSWATGGPYAQGAGHPRPHLQGVWPPWPTSGSALSPISSPQNPNTRGATTKRFRRLCGAENIERERALQQTDFCREIPSQRGEIVAINTVIKLDFIGIIII